MEQWTFVWYNGVIMSAPVIGEGVAEYLLTVCERTTEELLLQVCKTVYERRGIPWPE